MAHVQRAPTTARDLRRHELRDRGVVVAPREGDAVELPRLHPRPLRLTHDVEQDVWTRAALLVPLVAFAAYLAIGLRTLFVVHPAEDAYIMFRYVENFVAGRGIVFNPGGPRAEGATDFLWFALLSAFAKAGVNVAVAACVLNALGAALASFVCVAAVRASPVRGPWALLLSLFSLPLLVVGGAFAGYFGFSAMLYSALALYVFSLSFAASARSLPWIPMLGLALGLFRPDGVILGVAYTLIGFLFAARAGILRAYFRSALVALALGVIYFVARYLYFGLPLPLPLYVKQESGGAASAMSLLDHTGTYSSGLDWNLNWIKGDVGPARLAVCAAVLAIASGCSRGRLRKLLVLLAPSFLLFAALCIARQTQNVGFRFQAPLFIVVFYAAFWLLVQTIANHSSSRLVRAGACALFAAAVALPVSATMSRWESAWKNHSYLDAFPALLADALQPGRVIALTEAGRVPYWTRAEVVDVVGLNTPSAALAPPTLADLEALSPDIVMFSTSDVFEFVRPANARPVEPLTRAMFEAAVAPACRAAFVDGATPTGAFTSRENVAALNLARLLYTHEEYASFAVAESSTYGHVWGFKRNLPELSAILGALQTATSHGDDASYMELVRRRAAASALGSAESESRAARHAQRISR